MQGSEMQIKSHTWESPLGAVLEAFLAWSACCSSGSMSWCPLPSPQTLSFPVSPSSCLALGPLCCIWAFWEEGRGIWHFSTSCLWQVSPLFVCCSLCSECRNVVQTWILPVMCRCNEFPRNFREGMKVM